MKDSEPIIGIDLGTTNSCVATMDGSSPKVIPNRGGYRTTPSMVAIAENGKRLVGHVAKRQAVTNAQFTIFGSKRLIGRKWQSDIVQRYKPLCPYALVEGPHNDVRVDLRGTVLSLPEISAFILQEMKVVAEDYFGSTVGKAVITVPAYFDDGQRQATRDAGKIAGLQVLRIINEPTAAALAYGFGKPEFEDRIIAVYDLGGGTFDISILRINAGAVFEVLATAGDSFLGGEDFDRRIIDWLSAECQKEHGIDPRSEPMAMQRLKDAAEQAKIELSAANSSAIELPFLMAGKDGRPFHLRRSLSRQQFEEMTKDLVERTLNTCRKTLQATKLDPSKIAEVVLVGGMTRMPLVRDRVAELFNRRPSQGVNPDEAVALGAALQAAVVEGVTDDVLLLDVTPHDLGILVAGGAFDCIIPHNTPVPTGRTRVFVTTKDMQTTVRIMVLQKLGEAEELYEALGAFTLTELRPARAGEVEVEVTFNIDSDGIVGVAARDLETGKEASMTVQGASGLTEEEVAAMTDRNADQLVSRRKGEETEELRQRVERGIGEIKKLASKVRTLPDLSQAGPAVRAAMTAIKQSEDVKKGSDAAAMQNAIDALDQAKAKLKALVDAAPGGA
jgi:molecular chaperone DnaK